MSTNDNSINARFCWQTRIRSRVISILSATPTDCLKKQSMLVNLFSAEKIFSAIFDFHFRENPRFRDEFQALIVCIMRVQKKMAAWLAKCCKMPESDICVCRKAKVVESQNVYMLK